jgi:hypothetical protein
LLDLAGFVAQGLHAQTNAVAAAPPAPPAAEGPLFRPYVILDLISAKYNHALYTLLGTARVLNDGKVVPRTRIRRPWTAWSRHRRRRRSLAWAPA